MWIGYLRDSVLLEPSDEPNGRAQRQPEAIECERRSIVGHLDFVKMV